MNKIFLITGTSKGIGHSIAKNALTQGYFVVGCSRGNASIQNKNYIHHSIDIANEKEVINLFKQIRNKFSRLDVLINNAAVNPSIMPSTFLPTKTVKDTFAINLFSPMLFCRESVKLMNRNKFGRIINIGSMATKHEVSGEALYTSTKSALNAYSRVLAKEVYPFGITVNVVAPSAIKTDLIKKINQNALQEVLNRNAIHTHGEMGDVLNLINMLIKTESHAITGQILYLGGV